MRFPWVSAKFAPHRKCVRCGRVTYIEHKIRLCAHCFAIDLIFFEARLEIYANRKRKFRPPSVQIPATFNAQVN
jgi:hypothetical protein